MCPAYKFITKRGQIHVSPSKRIFNFVGKMFRVLPKLTNMIKLTYEKKMCKLKSV